MDQGTVRAVYEGIHRGLREVELDAGQEPVEEDHKEQTPDGWPQLSAEALHGRMGELVGLIEPHTESDRAALLLQSLVMFGNLIGRYRYFVADGSWHYLNLFLALVGVTSKGRKGTSWAQSLGPFKLIDGDWALENIQGGLGSGEGLIWSVRDSPAKDDPGISDKRFLIHESELSSILRIMAREGNTLSATLRQAWDTGNLRIITKNKPAKSTGAHISIVAHITKSELLTDLRRTDQANGFANRFLWACVKRSKCLPDGGELHKVNFEPIVKALQDSMNYSMVTGEMRRDDGARKIWHDVYPELSEGQPGLFGSITSRAEAQVMRLACLYALLDRKEKIGAEHLKAGLALWDYCEDSARYIFGDAIGDLVADAILMALRAKPEGLTRTEISNLFERNKTKEEIDLALARLREARKVDCKPIKTNGRSAEVWFAIEL